LFIDEGPPGGASLSGYNIGRTADAQELLQKALTLPDNERTELAGNLIASLDATIDPDVDAAWQAEIARRFHEVQSGQVQTAPFIPRLPAQQTADLCPEES
jgi:putative addiction module component (TIGR02574 family)